MAGRRKKMTAKERLIASTKRKIVNREKKLREAQEEMRERIGGINRELAELRELLKALGVKE